MQKMANVPFSLRINEETKKRLKREAARMDRSETYFATMAIEKELRARECKRQAIDTALEEAEKGHFISSEAMGAWVDSWSTDDEVAAPKADYKISP